MVQIPYVQPVKNIMIIARSSLLPGNKRPGRVFIHDSVREIIGDPFYVGMVVRRRRLILRFQRVFGHLADGRRVEILFIEE
jgi:hypothetical protein